MKYAYLIGALDISGETPVFKGVQIFSESSPTIGRSMYPFVIMETQGESYIDAVQQIKEAIDKLPQYKWLKNQVDFAHYYIHFKRKEKC